MRLATFRTGKVFILYDADSLCDANGAPQIAPSTFDPDHWRRQGLITGEAPGRGASLFLDVGGAEWVLRPYRRGGLAARVSASRYLWTGVERSRSFHECRLTAHLFSLGLPAPRPVAAVATRHGPTYEAALVTVRLPAARALAERLHDADEALLARVGATVRRFHDAGLDHVDLNARNLLVDDAERVWLIDFDRCRLRRPGKWQAANLERLDRSLTKFNAAPAMAAIRRGYASHA
ncbi:3-deoxy-D-manno-octulosonic acid kinase [Halomonas borealis]|jgi:3-deoxy-D-manno-octulosonic acid kinase|uniref:3-deoxy-D-manno-octulosonic acid kinase n=1 Tax=Halomonas borealis TaxID=2508710 RepID=UPI00109F38FB|nr:3-deoxy-D-manno-octulosonic acid kinase [Halomonas borealis]